MHIFLDPAQMAIDVLSTLATEVEVERIVSTTQQVSPFQCNCINANTFQPTMMMQQNNKLLKA
jgi:hypothetical protein